MFWKGAVATGRLGGVCGSKSSTLATACRFRDVGVCGRGILVRFRGPPGACIWGICDFLERTWSLLGSGGVLNASERVRLFSEVANLLEVVGRCEW